MTLSVLNALSPLDGRYYGKVDALRRHFSEYGLIRYRVLIELEWFKALAAEPGITEIAAFSDTTIALLDQIIEEFNEYDAEQIKAIEQRTNHDVKAIEYWIRGRLGADPEIRRALEFIHFACTSEDISNLAYALMLKEFADTELIPALARIDERLGAMARRYQNVALSARVPAFVAVAFDGSTKPQAAAVVSRLGVPGDRQRLNLAHELGHLVLKIPPLADQEKLAFRFGAALLAPSGDPRTVRPGAHRFARHDRARLDGRRGRRSPAGSAALRPGV